MMQIRPDPQIHNSAMPIRSRQNDADPSGSRPTTVQYMIYDLNTNKIYIFLSGPKIWGSWECSVIFLIFPLCVCAEAADWTEEEGWGEGGEGGAALPLEVTNLETEIRSSILND
jgi:hypothetical protein